MQTAGQTLLSDNHLKFYHENGFCIVDGLLTPAECRDYMDQTERIAERQEHKYANAMNPDRTHLAFARLIRDPRIIRALEKIQKTKVSALQSMIFFRPPGSLGRDMHQDNYYAQAEKGAYIGIWIALENAGRENGGMIAYPGSHREALLSIVEDKARQETNLGDFKNDRGFVCAVPSGYEKVYLTIPAGSCLFIHGQLIHGSEENLSKTRFRRVFAAHYIKKGFQFVSGTHAKRYEIDIYSNDIHLHPEAG